MKPLAEINSFFSDKAKLGHSSSALLALIFFSLLILTSYAHLAHADGSKIVKWKDANGVTHYGDKMPAQEAGRVNSVLNNQGTVIKTNESFNAKDNSVETDKRSAEQQRQDKALLASYSSAEEINLAEKRNLKSDEAALLLLNQSLDDSKAHYSKFKRNFQGKKCQRQQLKLLKTIKQKYPKQNHKLSACKLALLKLKHVLNSTGLDILN
jgi:peroxiredoxin family protein